MLLGFFSDINDPRDILLVFLYALPVALGWFYAISRWRNLIASVLAHLNPAKKSNSEKGRLPDDLPHVTIQIATYNEEEVVVKTIESACTIDWPKDKLTVQVLDDSTTKSSIAYVSDQVLRFRENGIVIEHRSRPTRIGYKAGNLAHHFDSISGDYVLQLDADHRVDSDFLKNAMPYFFDENGVVKPQIGLVQAPWGFYNTHHSLLTAIDALSLDTHHVVEQTGRSELYGVFSFNGTGGIWRKDAIKDGGGWTWVSET